MTTPTGAPAINVAASASGSTVWQIAMSNRSPWVNIGLFSTIIGILALTQTFFMLEVYGRVVTSGNLTTLLMLLVLALAALLLMELLDLARLQVLSRIGQKLDETLRLRVVEALFQSQLDRKAIHSAQALNDLRTVRDFVASPAVTGLADVVGVPLMLAVLFLMSPLLGAMALAGAILMGLLALSTEQKIVPKITEAGRGSSEATGYAAVAMRGAGVIQAFGAFPWVLKRWMARQSKFIGLQSSASEDAGSGSAVSKFVQTLQGSLLLGASCWVALHDSAFAAGSLLIVASTLGSRVLTPLTTVVSQWRSIVAARDSAKRLNALLNAHPSRPEVMSLPAPTGKLVLEGVSASAPGSSRQILKGVRFGIQPGQVVAIIGASASGKSTLARVMVGAWPVDTGVVRLDGADIHRWNREELGPYLGYVPQDIELFDGTIAENVARFGDINESDVERACAQAGLQGVIKSMPDGYNTRIGEEGVVLSGGMSQRLALARALYGKPRLVVMDEPDSNLDTEGLQFLVQAVADLKASGAAVVLITHRTGVLSTADALVVMQDGAVTLAGPRDAVLERLRQGAQKSVPTGPVTTVPGLVQLPRSA